MGQIINFENLPSLVEITRGKIAESRHRGVIAVVNNYGKEIFSIGPTSYITFMRSSAKPLQAIPIVESGCADYFNFTDEELAIMTGSHSSEEKHINVINRIISKIGISQTALICGPHYPIDQESSDKMKRLRITPTEIHSNCSGKHLGMIAYSIFLTKDYSNYFLNDHPVQKEILKTVSRFTQIFEENIYLGIDGCGVPSFALPIKNMALSFAKLIEQTDLSAKRIVNAMQRYPEMVAGTNRLCTDLMKSIPNLIAKAGAEGVYCIGFSGKLNGNSESLGIAIKIEDGNSSRTIAPIVVKLLKYLGILSQDNKEFILKYDKRKITTIRGDIEVGEIRTLF